MATRETRQGELCKIHQRRRLFAGRWFTGRWFAGNLLCIAMVMGSMPAQSAEINEQNNASKGSIFEEIIVTATKRGAESIQDLPQAIQAIGGEQLEAIGATQFDQWAGQISGLNYEDDGPGDKDYVVRGVNSDLGGTVGVYYDEAVITGKFTQNGGGHQLDLKLHDIDRLEVLKGPQGTLYGASSMSGTIRQITNKPLLENVEVSIETMLSSTEEASGLNSVVSAMANLPLVENVVGLRAVVWKHDTQGYIDNVRLNLDAFNNEKVDGGRLHLAWQLNEDVDLLFSYTAQNLESKGRSRFTPKGSVYPGDVSPLGALPMPAIEATKDFQNAEYARTPWDEQVDIVSLTANWHLSRGTFTATYNRLDRDIDYFFDSTPILIAFSAPVPAVTTQEEARVLQSSEFRFASELEGPINFVVGGFVQAEDLDFDIGVVTADAAGKPTGALSSSDSDDFFLAGGNSIFGRTFDEQADSWAVFGEANIVLNEQWAFNLGGRWFDSEATTDSREVHPFVGFLGRPKVFAKRKVNDAKFSGKVNLTWQPNDEALYYMTLSQGFRQGGVNSTIVLDPTVVIPDGFDADELTSLEFGFKTSWLKDLLHINGAVYHTQWQDMQVADSLSGFSFTDNIGKTDINGLEFDVIVMASEGLELGVGGAFIDTQLQEDEPASVGLGSGVKGDELPMVPRFSGYIFAQYGYSIGGGLEGFAHLSANYRGNTATELNRANPFYHKIDSYTRVNLNVGIDAQAWKVAAFVNNLTGEEGPVDINENLDNAFSYIPVTPRTVGMRLRYDFN